MHNGDDDLLVRQRPTTGIGLAVVRALLERLHAAAITYCHWKSNEHLGAALDGLTDLDILVDRRHGRELDQVLVAGGFRRFAAPPLRAYPAIEDHLALDAATGRLVHLHLHYQLTLGQAHLKGYRLPVEDLLLAARRLDREHGIYVADPADELELLVLRGALKRRLRQRLRRARGRPVGGDLARELDWLRQRVDVQGLGRLTGALAGAAVGPLRDLLAGPLTPARLDGFAAVLRPALRPYRTFGRLEAAWRAWLRELQWVWDAVNRRYLHRGVPLRRTSPRGGVIIAVLGPDGAGKSTLTRSLRSWLAVKLDVVPIYFGSGQGPSAVYRWPLQLARRLVERPAHTPAPASPRTAFTDSNAGGRLLRTLGLALWAVTLSCEKRGKLRRAVRARNRGMIVLCDRFPQNEILGFNDGPLLATRAATGSWLWRALARFERRPYAAAALNPPDLIIKLRVSPEVAVARKPEMTLAETSRRLAAVRALRFAPATEVVEIDADAAPSEILRKAQHLVWGLL